MYPGYKIQQENWDVVDFPHLPNRSNPYIYCDCIRCLMVLSLAIVVVCLLLVPLLMMMQFRYYSIVSNNLHFLTILQNRFLSTFSFTQKDIVFGIQFCVNSLLMFSSVICSGCLYVNQCVCVYVYVLYIFCYR